MRQPRIAETMAYVMRVGATGGERLVAPGYFCRDKRQSFPAPIAELQSRIAETMHQPRIAETMHQPRIAETMVYVMRVGAAGWRTAGRPWLFL